MSDFDPTSAAWAFVRREDAISEFQENLRRSPALVTTVGTHIAREALTTPYDDDRQVFQLRQRVWAHLAPASAVGCLCRDWPDRRIIALGAATVNLLHEEFETLRDRSPWLHLVRCRACGGHWYAAVDTVDDDYYFLRLSHEVVTAIEDLGEWPADFDAFVHVWPEPKNLTDVRVTYPWR
jgi:hypothetical protein